MRMFIILVVAALAASTSLYASAGGSRGLSLERTAAQSEHKGRGLRCAKKIAIAPGSTEFTCLMQKRKGRPT